MDKPIEIPFLKNIGLFVTYKCQIACRHCIVQAGPHRTEALDLDDAYDWIHQIARYENDYVAVLSLTGGEPFYDLENLKRISDFGKRCGLFISAVTNAFWASTPEIAYNILSDLPAIKMLSISADVYHQQQIPFHNVQNVINAARACNIPFTISVCTENEDDPDYLDIFEKLKKLADPEIILTAITFRAGRALRQIDRNRYAQSSTPPISACVASNSPIIFPDGRVIACIGPIIDLRTDHPLILGNLREDTLQEIFNKAQANPILHAIRLWGPQHLVQIIEQAGLNAFLPVTYVKDSICHLCYELMANLTISRFLGSLMDNKDFIRKVAYGRMHYLQEMEMLKLLKITD